MHGMLPGHVAVAVEGVRDQVEGPERDEGVEGPRRDAADLVGVEREGVQVDEAVEQLLVHFGDRIFGKGSAKKCLDVKWKHIKIRCKWTWVRFSPRMELFLKL